MADTIDKRVSDIEQIIAHLPEDLDARFAGVDAKLAGIREVQALHTTRFTKLETRLGDIERKLDTKIDALDAKVDKLTAQVGEALLLLRMPPKT